MRRLTSVWLMLLGLAAALPAQAADATTQAARQHYQQGTTLYREARYADAIEEFKAAYEAKQNGVVYFNIAQCYEKLGELEGALTSYRRYLQEVPTADDRATVETVIGNLAQRAAKERVQKVTITTDPSGAQVGVDSAPRGSTPLGLELGPGTHAFHVALDGFNPVDRSVTVGNAPVQLDLTLSALPRASAPLAGETTTGHAPATAASTQKRVWTWVAFGAGGATAITAMVIGGMAKTSERALQAGVHDRQTATSLEHAAKSRASTSNVFWGITGGLAAVGVTLIFVEGKF